MRTEKKKEHRGSFWSGRGGRFFSYLLVFCWPVLYLFNHVFPINGLYTAIGNDFIVLYYKYKIYLLDHLANFSFPLWSPAEGAGFPFYISPFAQAFYPFNLPLAVWYKISGGYTPLDHQIFTVFGISIFALGLFVWLRSININLRACFFAAIVMSVSFKVTEITRFPNAVHTAAWYPWILYALTKIMKSRSLKEAAKAGVFLIFFAICFCTAGYFYYVYYSLFLFIPYAIIFLVKPLREQLIGKEQICWKRAIMILLLAAFAIMLICGPYLLGVRQLMAQTTDRAGKDFAYSTKHIFSLEDTAGSLVYPPASAAEGWYFFSITALLVISLYLFTAPKETGANLWVKLFFIGWLVLISYITYGRQSYLFELLWKYSPGFSGLRVWGRLNIVLVPVFAWLLSIAYGSFESSILQKNSGGKYSRIIKTIVALVVVYVAILGIQLYMYHNKIYDSMWPKYFANVSASDIKFIIYGGVAFAVICAVVALGGRWKGKGFLTAALIILIAMATIEMRHVGAHMWARQKQADSTRQRLNVAKINEISFNFRRTENTDTIPFGPVFNVGVLDNWYFDRYVRFLERTKNELDARRILSGQADGRRLFFSESIEYPTVTAFLRDAVRYRENAQKVLSYTGDDLVLEFNAPAHGYLSFIDNWDYGWKAFVDGKEEKIDLLFGTFKSVKVSPGMHRVKFSYEPGWFFRAKQ